MLGALVNAGALAVALSACGSSGSSSGLSRSDLVSKANAICQTAQTAAKAVPQPTSLQDAATAAAYFDKVAPITAKETADMQALNPDGSASGDWKAFIAQQVSANALLQTIKSKADAKDPSGLQDLQKVKPQGDQVAAAATKLGATVCAQ
jgi:hypothetical protein